MTTRLVDKLQGGLCKFCDLIEVKPFVIKEFEYWTLILNARQYYLGRIFLKLNRHEEDVVNLEKRELIELWDLIKISKFTLDKLFSPNWYNYTFLGNTIPHLHCHIVPRYKRERIFENVVFKDENFGRTYYSYRERPISNNVYERLVEVIKKNIHYAEKL